MTGPVDRLTFLHANHSFAWISEQTGIPKSTISYVMRGERRLPSQYAASLRNAYQRDAYAQLRARGLSSTQARRFSWYPPSTVLQVESSTSDIVQRIVDYRFQAYKDALIARGEYTNDADVRQRLTEGVQEAIQRSDLPQEQLVAIEYKNTSEL